MGRKSCWEVVGPAREDFYQIAERIKIYLKRNSDPVPYPVIWTMYMIGQLENTARPTIMFCSKDKTSRKKIRDEVEKSGILDGYPGVKLGDADRPPDFDYLVPLALVEESLILKNFKSPIPSYWSLEFFPYPELGWSEGNFRLLEILPRTDPSRMDCRPFVASLINPPKYTVILGAFEKYSHFRGSLEVDGRRYDIPIEIFHILELLASKECQTVIWIEALCIDTENPEERERQLDMLSSIEKGAFKAMWPWEIQPESANETAVYGNYCNENQFFNCTFRQDRFSLWKATGGAFFWSEDKVYQTTIAHGFLGSVESDLLFMDESPRTNMDQNQGDIEYDIEDFFDLESNEQELMDLTSKGSLTPDIGRSAHSDETKASTEPIYHQLQTESAVALDRQNSSESRITKEPDIPFEAVEEQNDQKETSYSISSGQSGVSRHIFDACLHPIGKILDLGVTYSGLDYSLIELHYENYRPFNQITFETDARETSLYPQGVSETPVSTDVFAKAGSHGVISGRSSGVPSYIQIPGFSTSRELWTVRLNGKLRPGDSGSLVADVENSNMLGHIISGSPESGVAYIIPMYHILRDIRSHIDKNIEIPNRRDIWNRMQPVALELSTRSSSVEILDHGKKKDGDSRITLVEDNANVQRYHNQDLPFQHVKTRQNRQKHFFKLLRGIFSTKGLKTRVFANKEKVPTLNTEEIAYESPWVIPVFVLSAKKNDKQLIAILANCTVDTGNILGNLVSKQFVESLLELNTKPLTRKERHIAQSITEGPVPEYAVYLTWYHKHSTRVFHNMRFLVTNETPYDLVLGARSIQKDGIMLIPSAYTQPGSKSASSTPRKWKKDKYVLRKKSGDEPIHTEAVMKATNTDLKTNLAPAAAETSSPSAAAVHYASKLTVADLLSHRSGSSASSSLVSLSNNSKLIGKEECIRIWDSLEVLRETRTKFIYNDHAYNIVGLMVEGLSGKTWGDLVQELVLHPLGMKRTYVFQPRDNNSVVAHAVLQDDAARRVPSSDIDVKTIGFVGQSLKSNLGDLLTWSHTWLETVGEDTSNLNAQTEEPRIGWQLHFDSSRQSLHRISELTTNICPIQYIL
ncbi:hypothetical protein NHQ30_008121 [Ciborinia camelliae]|nr:hypothetical protein NHQ30_008121 [Ciborinia camelliae]